MTKIHPVGHRILLKMDSVETVSKGGIVLAREHGTREQAGVETGEVMEIGSQAFKAFEDGEPWCVVGDIVRVVRFSGSNDDAVYRDTGVMYRIVNDEDILATIERQ